MKNILILFFTLLTIPAISQTWYNIGEVNLAKEDGLLQIYNSTGDTLKIGVSALYTSDNASKHRTFYTSGVREYNGNIFESIRFVEKDFASKAYIQILTNQSISDYSVLITDGVSGNTILPLQFTNGIIPSGYFTPQNILIESLEFLTANYPFFTNGSGGTDNDGNPLNEIQSLSVTYGDSTDICITGSNCIKVPSGSGSITSYLNKILTIDGVPYDLSNINTDVESVTFDNNKLGVTEGGITKDVLILSEDIDNKLDIGSDGGITYSGTEDYCYSDLNFRNGTISYQNGNTACTNNLNKFHVSLFNTYDGSDEFGDVLIDTTDINKPAVMYVRYAKNFTENGIKPRITTNGYGFIDIVSFPMDSIILQKEGDWVRLVIDKNGSILISARGDDNNGSGSNYDDSAIDARITELETTKRRPLYVHSAFDGFNNDDYTPTDANDHVVRIVGNDPLANNTEIAETKINFGPIPVDGEILVKAYVSNNSGYEGIIRLLPPTSSFEYKDNINHPYFDLHIGESVLLKKTIAGSWAIKSFSKNQIDASNVTNLLQFLQDNSGGVTGGGITTVSASESGHEITFVRSDNSNFQVTYTDTTLTTAQVVSIIDNAGYLTEEVDPLAVHLSTDERQSLDTWLDFGQESTNGSSPQNTIYTGTNEVLTFEYLNGNECIHSPSMIFDTTANKYSGYWTSDVTDTTITITGIADAFGNTCYLLETVPDAPFSRALNLGNNAIEITSSNNVETYIDSKDGIIKSKLFELGDVSETTDKVGILGYDSDNKIRPIDLTTADLSDFADEIDALYVEIGALTGDGYLQGGNMQSGKLNLQVFGADDVVITYTDSTLSADRVVEIIEAANYVRDVDMPTYTSTEKVETQSNGLHIAFNPSTKTYNISTKVSQELDNIFKENADGYYVPDLKVTGSLDYDANTRTLSIGEIQLGDVIVDTIHASIDAFDANQLDPVIEGDIIYLTKAPLDSNKYIYAGLDGWVILSNQSNTSLAEVLAAISENSDYLTYNNGVFGFTDEYQIIEQSVTNDSIRISNSKTGTTGGWIDMRKFENQIVVAQAFSTITGSNLEEVLKNIDDRITLLTAGNADGNGLFDVQSNSTAIVNDDVTIQGDNFKVEGNGSSIKLEDNVVSIEGKLKLPSYTSTNNTLDTAKFLTVLDTITGEISKISMEALQYSITASGCVDQTFYETRDTIISDTTYVNDTTYAQVGQEPNMFLVFGNYYGGTDEMSYANIQNNNQPIATATMSYSNVAGPSTFDLSNNEIRKKTNGWDGYVYEDLNVTDSDYDITYDWEK